MNTSEIPTGFIVKYRVDGLWQYAIKFNEDFVVELYPGGIMRADVADWEQIELVARLDGRHEDPKKESNPRSVVELLPRARSVKEVRDE